MRARLPLPASGRTRLAGLLAVATSLIVVLVSSAGAQTPAFEATALEPDGAPIQGSKSRVGQIAQTDPDLLGRSDSAPVDVLVKLDYDSVATYEGGVQGLAATSPKKTGKKLKENQAAVDAYAAHVADVEQDIVSEIASEVSGETVRASYRVAYGGVAMQVPADQIDELLSVDGVVAVQKDSLEHPETSVTPAFTGASAVWPSLGGSSRAGEGVIVGVLDTGIWPEHPSFADPGINHPGGGPYGCEFGGADALLGPVFACNDKLIGAYAFTDTYMANIAAVAGEFCNNATDQCSARDSEGHGTHTSSTAAGGPVASAPLLGVDRGPISGMAPGAHVIQYRVCLRQGCFGSDSVAAVDQAILDGVDVINFSISGGASAYTDAVELAFLDAYEAGILVNASAGNTGPNAGTANHAGPWTNTVGASTSNRHFVGSLTLRASNGDTYTQQGATVTRGISTPTPVVRADDIPGQPDDLCRIPGGLPVENGVNFPPGSAAGKIVVCRREAGARVNKSFNVSQGGGVGMILYNGQPNLGLNTDNHWVPTMHVEKPVAGERPLIAFIESHTGVTATFDVGQRDGSARRRHDVVLVARPGRRLRQARRHRSGNPDPRRPHARPVRHQLRRRSAGPALPGDRRHLDVEPAQRRHRGARQGRASGLDSGQIKSALMTSSVQGVLKQDGVTPSDPFDRGAGSIRANRAVNADGHVRRHGRAVRRLGDGSAQPDPSQPAERQRQSDAGAGDDDPHLQERLGRRSADPDLGDVRGGHEHRRVPEDSRRRSW